MDRSAVAGLPDDILVQILSRVSVKDLHRSKCVSKAWCGLVADPLHRKELPQTLHGFFYGGRRSRGDASGIGEFKYEISLGYGHFINVLGRSAHLVDPTFSFLPGIDKLRLVDSCNGLLLFENAFDLTDMGFIVCNPVTEQRAAVPGSQEWPLTCLRYQTSVTYLVFDPAISSYFHLVMFLEQDERPAVHAYHSKTGAWSHSDVDWTEEERERLHRDLEYRLTSNAVLNGMCYLIFDENQTFQVDFEGKTRGVIPAPSSIVQWKPNYTAIFVGQSQGRLHCIHDVPARYPLLLSIWVLDDNGTQQWVLKHSVSLLRLFQRELGEYDREYKVVAIHPDRNLVFIVRSRNWQLISYNMDSKEVCALGTLGYECTRVTPFVPCFLDFLSN